MTVEYLGVGEHADRFVGGLLSVNELVPGKAIDASHVTPHKGKANEACRRVGKFVLEAPRRHK